MPNWATTVYTVLPNNEDGSILKRIENAITRIEKSDENSHHFATLYEILTELNVPEEEIKYRSQGNCRGYVIEHYLSDDGNMLTIVCETAWTEADLFRHKLEEKFDLAIFYNTEEPGMDIFMTNNPDYAGTVIADFLADQSYYGTQEEIIDIVNDYLHTDCETFKDLRKEIHRHNKETKSNGTDDYIYIHEFEYVND